MRRLRVQNISKQSWIKIKREYHPRAHHSLPIYRLRKNPRNEIKRPVNDLQIKQNGHSFSLNWNFLEYGDQKALVNTTIFFLAHSFEDFNQSDDNHLVVDEQVLDPFEGACNDTDKREQSMPETWLWGCNKFD